MTSKTAPHLTILTGASRGMGLSMARQLLKSGDTLLCISRTSQEALVKEAAAAGATLVQWTHDLADGAAFANGLRPGWPATAPMGKRQPHQQRRCDSTDCPAQRSSPR